MWYIIKEASSPSTPHSYLPPPSSNHCLPITAPTTNPCPNLTLHNCPPITTSTTDPPPLASPYHQHPNITHSFVLALPWIIMLWTPLGLAPTIASQAWSVACATATIGIASLGDLSPAKWCRLRHQLLFCLCEVIFVFFGVSTILWRARGQVMVVDDGGEARQAMVRNICGDGWWCYSTRGREIVGD